MARCGPTCGVSDFWWQMFKNQRVEGFLRRGHFGLEIANGDVGRPQRDLVTGIEPRQGQEQSEFSGDCGDCFFFFGVSVVRSAAPFYIESKHNGRKKNAFPFFFGHNDFLFPFEHSNFLFTFIWKQVPSHLCSQHFW